MKEYGVHLFPQLQHHVNEWKSDGGGRHQQGQVQTGKQPDDGTYSSSVHFANGNLFLAAFCIKRNAGIHSQQGNEDAYDCKNEMMSFRIYSIACTSYKSSWKVRTWEGIFSGSTSRRMVSIHFTTSFCCSG